METKKPTPKRAAGGSRSKPGDGASRPRTKASTPAVERGNPSADRRSSSLTSLTRERTAETAPASDHTPRPRVGARRGAAKRTIPRMLIDAPPDRCFWVNYGPILQNLRDLRDALAGELTEQQYLYHAVGGKNDFAAWVDAVLLEPECAAALRRAKSRLGAARAVGKFLERA